MDELMQALFDHITDHLLEKYYGRTAYAERCAIRDEIGRCVTPKAYQHLGIAIPGGVPNLMDQLSF